MEIDSTLENPPKIEKVYFLKAPLLVRIKSMVIDGVIILLLMMIASKILTFIRVESGIIRG